MRNHTTRLVSTALERHMRKLNSNHTGRGQEALKEAETEASKLPIQVQFSFGLALFSLGLFFFLPFAILLWPLSILIVPSAVLPLTFFFYLAFLYSPLAFPMLYYTKHIFVCTFITGYYMYVLSFGQSQFSFCLSQVVFI